MTPKEKAKKIWDYHYYFVSSGEDKNNIREICKQCALITIEEIIENQENIIALIEYKLLYHDIKLLTFSNYWQEVKREIQMI